MSHNTSNKITKLYLTRSFKVTRAELFKSWTDPEEIKKWFAPGVAHIPEASVDLRVGGNYRIHMRDDTKNASYIVTGIYREINPPSRIVFTWMWEGDPNSSEMLVTIELREKGNATDLTLTHEYFPSEESKKSHEEGWTGCLDKLAHILNT